MDKGGYFIMKLVKQYVIILIVLTITAAGGFFLGSENNLLKSNLVKTHDSTVILNKLSEVSELTTYKYEYTNVIISKTQNQKFGFNIPFNEAIKLIKYQGYIKAGTDFSKTKIAIDNNSKRITIKVPKSVIHENAVLVEKTVVEDLKGEVFSDYPPQLILEEISKDKHEIESRAIEEGLLEKSDTRVRLLCESLLMNFGFDEVVIEFIG